MISPPGRWCSVGEWEESMDRRNVLSLSAITALGLTLLSDNALGQQAADVEGVKAASKAFYVALAALDNGVAMEKVWAHTPYVTYVGPRSKTIIVGWDAQKKYWVDTDPLFSQRNVTLSDTRAAEASITEDQAAPGSQRGPA